MSKLLIPATTAAAVSDRQAVNRQLNGDVPHIESTLFALGLEAAEVIVIELAPTVDETAPWILENTAVELTATNNSFVIRGSVPIIANKPVTSKAVSVWISTPLDV